MKRLFFCALALSLCLCGCTGTVTPTPTPTQSLLPTPTQGNTNQAESTIFAMDTMMSLRVYGENAQDMLALITNEINSLERTLSVTKEGSDVWVINHAGGEPVKVGDDAAHLLELAKILGGQTGGALDVTMYPVVKAWGFAAKESTDISEETSHRVPPEEELAGLLERVDYEKIDVVLKSEDIISSHLDSYVTLPEGMELDLGAIAKGYAGEKAADLLRENGVTSALLNMGGNVQTVGAKPDGTPWSIGLQDPNSENKDYLFGAVDYLGVLRVVDQAVVTSGGYQRYFEEDGIRYWHIMDPTTGAPARSGVIQATIIAHDGGLCDGLSTSLFVMGVERALDYWRTYGGFEAVLVDEDYNVWITAGLKDSFVLMEGSPYTLHIVEE